MQVASVLSDLTSLRVCVRLPGLVAFTSEPASVKTDSYLQEHSAALALVSVHKQGSDKQSSTEKEHSDEDMRRAIDLTRLHYGVKMKYKQGDDESLRQARRDVDSILRNLKKNTDAHRRAR